MTPWDRLREMAAGALPRQIEYTTPQLPPEAGPLDRLAALGADVGATLLEASAAGQGAVQSAYGNAFAPLAAQGNQPFIPPAQQAELAGLIAAGATGQQKFEAMQAANPFQSGIGDLAADIASDPISWIPGGTAGKAALALKARGVTNPAAQGAEAILKALDTLDTGPGKLVAGAIKAPIEGVKFLADASKATRVAQEMRGLEDLTNYIKPVHSWQVDLADHFGGKVIPDYPGTTEGARHKLAELQADYGREIQGIADPAARAAALQMKGQVDQLMEAAYTRAFLTREGLRTDYGDDVLSAATALGPDLDAGYKEIGQAFEQAFGSAAQAIQAGRFGAKQLAERAADAAADPTLMPQLERAQREMANIVASYAPQIRDAGVEGRLALVEKRKLDLQAVVDEVKALAPLPDDLATLVPRRFKQLDYLLQGDSALKADLPDRFAGQDELIQRVLDEVQSLAGKKRTKELGPDADLYGMALEAIRKQRADEVGLGASNPDLPRALQQLQQGIGQGVGLGTGLLKEFMLTTGAYSASNLSGTLAMSALKGVKPQDILKRLPEHLKPALAGKAQPVVGHDVQNWLDLTEQPLHGGLLSDVGMQAEFVATQDWADKARKTASEKIGSKWLAGGGGFLGGTGQIVTDDEGADLGDVAKGATVGAVLGAGFPKASRYMRGIAAAVESAAREAAFLKGAAERTAVAKQDLGREVVQALAEKRPTLAPGPGGIGRVVTSQGTPPAQFKQTLDDLREVFDRQGGVVSPTTLEAVLIKNGMAFEQARQLGHSWQSKLDDASQAGVKLSHEINFDYENLNNFEQFMRTVVPFSTWALKAYPFFAKQLAERPALAVGIRELNDMTEEERTGMGLTGRFTGSVPLGAGDLLFGALLGRDVKAFFSPLRSVVPFSDVGRSLQSVAREEGGGPLGKPLGIMEAFLPGPHPAIQLGMRLSGLLGNAPPEGLSFGGAARPLAALTGVDLNAPGVALERTIRQGFGQEPVDFKDSAILKRIDELAVGQTGHTTRDKLAAVTPYQQAKVNRKGPIWDQAKGEVERETAVRSTVGFLGGPVAPQALLSPEEEAIRGARRPPETGGSYVQFDPGAGEELRERIKRGEAGVAASPRVMKAMLEQLDDLYGENIPAPAQRLLEVGTNEAVNNLQSELYQLQVGAEPLIGAYGSQASTKAETDLRNVLGLYHNPRALLADDPAFMRLSPAEQDRIGRMLEQYGAATPSQQRLLRSVPMEAWLKAVQSRKEVMRKNQPALDDYLNYEAERRGAGTIEDYFATRK